MDQLYPHVSISEISVMPTGVIIALCDYGVLRSTDKGKTWSYCLYDYPNGCLAFGKNGSLYVPSREGIYSSPNYGNTWSYADSISKFTYNGLVFAEIFGSITVTSNNYVFATSGSSVFCSTDRGMTWYRPDTSFKGIYVQNIAQIRDTLFVISESGLSRSTNYGNSWERLSVDNTLFSVLYTDSRNNIYLSRMSSSTSRSSDCGVSWQEVYDGFFEGFTVGRDNMILAAERHLFKSTDNGITWNVAVDVSSLGVGTNAIALDNDGYLYVGASITGIYKSKKSFYE